MDLKRCNNHWQMPRFLRPLVPALHVLRITWPHMTRLSDSARSCHVGRSSRQSLWRLCGDIWDQVARNRKGISQKNQTNPKKSVYKMYIYCNIWYVRDGACGLLYAPTPADPPIQKYIRKYKKKKKKKIYKTQKYISLFKSHITHSCIISYRH